LHHLDLPEMSYRSIHHHHVQHCCARRAWFREQLLDAPASIAESTE
jgi:hypothetical protein